MRTPSCPRGTCIRSSYSSRTVGVATTVLLSGCRDADIDGPHHLPGQLVDIVQACAAHAQSGRLCVQGEADSHFNFLAPRLDRFGDAPGHAGVLPDLVRERTGKPLVQRARPRDLKGGIAHGLRSQALNALGACDFGAVVAPDVWVRRVQPEEAGGAMPLDSMLLCGVYRIGSGVPHSEGVLASRGHFVRPHGCAFSTFLRPSLSA